MRLLARMDENASDRHGPGKLRVYHLALELCDQVDTLRRQAKCAQSLGDQATRSAESCVLNTAEGAGHRSPGKKIYHYQLAHGSAWECIGALRRISRQHPTVDVRPARYKAEMVAMMLLALIKTWQKRRDDSRRKDSEGPDE